MEFCRASRPREGVEANGSQGEKAPQVALFYDTRTLQHNGEGRHIDLTTDEGKDRFYTTIRDFFSPIPPKMWTMRRGGPIVLLYSAASAKAVARGVLLPQTAIPRGFRL